MVLAGITHDCNQLRADRLPVGVMGVTGPFSSSCSKPARLIYLVVMQGSPKQQERTNFLMHKNLSVSTSVTSVIMPLAKSNPMANPKFKGLRNRLHFLMRREEFVAFLKN